jgi:4-amino-4-deoxy-L-arabinose transferase-like glycosyltransferase
MPWTLLLPISAAALLKGGRKKELLKLAAWVAAVVIFFSLSKGKRNLYILLAYPAMSIIVAGAADLFDALSQKWRRNTMIACASFMAAVSLAEVNLVSILRLYSSITDEAVELPFAPALLMYPAAAAVAGLAVVLCIYRERNFGRATVIAMGAAYALHWALVANIIYPAMNDAKTPASIVETVRPFAEAGESMIVYGGTSEIVPLYCNMRSVSATNPEELHQKMGELQAGVLVFRENAWKTVKSVIAKHVVRIGECEVGHKKMVIARFDMKE